MSTARRRTDVPLPSERTMVAAFLLIIAPAGLGQWWMTHDDSRVRVAEDVGPHENIDIALYTNGRDGKTVVQLDSAAGGSPEGREVSIVGVDGTRLGGLEYQPPRASQQEIRVEVTWEGVEEPGWPWESNVRETPPTVTTTATLTRGEDGKATLTEGPPAAASTKPVERNAQSQSFRLSAAGSVEPVPVAISRPQQLPPARAR